MSKGLWKQIQPKAGAKAGVTIVPLVRCETDRSVVIPASFDCKATEQLVFPSCVQAKRFLQLMHKDPNRLSSMQTLLDVLMGMHDYREKMKVSRGRLSDTEKKILGVLKNVLASW